MNSRLIPLVEMIRPSGSPGLFGSSGSSSQPVTLLQNRAWVYGSAQSTVTLRISNILAVLAWGSGQDEGVVWNTGQHDLGAVTGLVVGVERR